MGEIPIPEPKLEYSEVAALYDRVKGVFNEFVGRSDVQTRKIGDAVELIKTVPELPEGSTEWLLIFREIYGKTHLYRISRIMQVEDVEGNGAALEAAVTTFSFLALTRGNHTTVHSTRWGEEKALGMVAPRREYGALLDAHMTPIRVYEAAEEAPILSKDKTEIDDMLADWR